MSSNLTHKTSIVPSARAAPCGVKEYVQSVSYSVWTAVRLPEVITQVIMSHYAKHSLLVCFLPIVLEWFGTQLLSLFLGGIC